MSSASKTASNAGVYLGVAVADEEAQGFHAGVEVVGEVADLLGDPFAGGVRGDAGDVEAAGAVFEEHQSVETPHGDGVDVHEVAGDDGGGLSGKEFSPGWAVAAWRGVDAGRAREIAELIAARHPDRGVHVVGDAAYVGEHLRGLDTQITWTSRLKVTSVLHELPPPPTGRSGRPRTKGARLGTPTDIAATAAWAHNTGPPLWAHRHCAHHGRICLWYGSFHTRPERIILVRDDKPRTLNGDDRGYGLPLVTTDLESPAEELVTRYAARWGIEQAFADARQVLGIGEARNRLRRAWNAPCPSA